MLRTSNPLRLLIAKIQRQDSWGFRLNRVVKKVAAGFKPAWLSRALFHLSKHVGMCFIGKSKLGVSQMTLSFLAERRKPSGECPVNAAKPEGSPRRYKNTIKRDAIEPFGKRPAVSYKDTCRRA